MTIFDLITSKEIVAYWNGMEQDREPFPAEELFPNKKQYGISLKWIKGSKGLPVVLKNSAFDTFAIPRARIGFDQLTAEMPYFKESKTINEELRMQLNNAIAANNQTLIDMLVSNIFDDQSELLESARVSRERMRMMALTTGVIAMENNGQTFAFDYGIPSEHKVTVTADWENSSEADPMEDIRKGIEKIADDTGNTVTRAMCSRKTWRDLRNCEKIKKEIYVLTNGMGAITDAKLKQYLMDEFGLTVVINPKRYKDEKGKTTQYMPDDTFVMFPDGYLGNTCMGTTPAESDLMTSNVANVAIADTGVAVTTVKKADPVSLDVIVSMVCLPDFPEADSVYIIDTKQ